MPLLVLQIQYPSTLTPATACTDQLPSDDYTRSEETFPETPLSFFEKPIPSPGKPNPLRCAQCFFFVLRKAGLTMPFNFPG